MREKCRITRERKDGVELSLTEFRDSRLVLNEFCIVSVAPNITATFKNFDVKKIDF
jgi:hypothetical protein